MARELGGSQISALLESVPGIVNVLRSPVADALVGMIRAGARLEEFRLESAQELIQYAVRRGLIGASEGDRLLEDVTAVARKARGRKKRPAKARRAKGRASTTRAASGGSARRSEARARTRRSAKKASKKAKARKPAARAKRR